jgi:signal transduction histidine kinase
MSVEFLRRLPIFTGVSDEDLNWLVQKAQPVTIRAGEFLMEEGSPGDSMYIVVDGEFKIIKRSNLQDIVIAMREAGEVIGEMALIDHAPRIASVKAVRDSQVLMIHEDAFHQLITSSPSAALAILHTVSARMRQNESLVRQNEKMAALGTLAAGLAHELNNPAAAARRSTEQLRQTLTDWQHWTMQLDALALDPHLAKKVEALREAVTQRSSATNDLDALARSDQESALQDWLEAHGVDEAWDLAPEMVAFGWDVNALSEFGEALSTEHLSLVARWIAASGTVYTLLDEVKTSAERISEIVKSVKAYSYLDQAPIQQVDVHEGLDNTLVILRHKTKTGVKIKREYASNLPQIEAYGSQLNQVWTNILDNAIDAMQGQGQITLRTRLDDNCVIVEIEDNGPDIPPEIQSRIFEPFFTTKAPGVGTGLGLHIAYDIISKHYGQIRLNSQPGSTCFQVELPVQFPRG